MLYCDKCKVSITGEVDKCPLCQGDVRGEITTENTFPKIHKKRHLLPFILKLVAIITISVAILSILCDIAFGLKWSIREEQRGQKGMRLCSNDNSSWGC